MKSIKQYFEEGRLTAHIEGEAFTPRVEFSDEDNARFARGVELFQSLSPDTVHKLIGTEEEWAAAWKQAGLPPTLQVDPGPEI